MRTILLSQLMILTWLPLFGQMVSGRVIDKNAEIPLALAEILLFDLDMKYSSNVLADENGRFAIKVDGKLIIQQHIIVNYLGYKSDTISLKDYRLIGDTINVGIFYMEPIPEELKGVEIIAKKPPYTISGGMITLNVANSLLSEGGNTYDLMNRAPGVMIDPTGNILLRNRTGVTIQINGKSSNLFGEALTAYLKSLLSTNIEKIEIITNPKANQDAAGTAGIINIVLKKNEITGIVSNVFGGLSRGIYTRGNIGANLTFRPNENNGISLNINNYAGKFLTKNSSFRRILNETENEKISEFDQRGKSVTDLNNLNFGFGYEHNGQRSITNFLFSGFSSSNRTNNESITQVNGWNQDSIVNFSGNNNSTNKYITISLNHKIYVDTVNGYLEINASYFPSKFNSDQDQISNFLDYEGNNLSHTTREKFSTPSNINIAAISADIVKTISFGDLDAGIKISKAQSDNNLKAYRFVDGIWSYDFQRSNHFKYDENIYAIYTGLSYSIGSVSIYNGVRLERSNSKGNSITLDSSFTRQFTNVFPNISASFNLGEVKTSISYGRRIDRPVYNQLNPFTYYIDRFSYWKGNTTLIPQFTNTFEINCNYKWLTFAANISKTNNLFTQIPVQDHLSGNIYNTNQNIGYSNYYGMTITTNNYLTNKWTMFNNFGLYHIGVVDERNIVEDNNTAYGTQFTFSSQQTYVFNAKYSCEVGFQYNSRNISFWQMKAYSNLNIGIRRTFSNKSALSIQIYDLLNNTQYDSSINYGSLDINNSYKPETRYIGLNYYYTIGNGKTKRNKKISSSLEEEKSRVKYN